MATVVRHNYPAGKLPDDLRQGIDPSKEVTIIIEEEERPEHVISLEEIFASRRPPYLSREEIDRHIRQLRGDRDDD